MVQIRILVCKCSFEFLLQHEQRVVCLWLHIFDVPSYGMEGNPAKKNVSEEEKHRQRKLNMRVRAVA